MVDYYRFVVSKNGHYLFATESGENGNGIQTIKHAEEIFSLFKQKFPETEGYRVTCIRWESRGAIVKGFTDL